MLRFSSLLFLLILTISCQSPTETAVRNNSDVDTLNEDPMQGNWILLKTKEWLRFGDNLMDDKSKILYRDSSDLFNSQFIEIPNTYTIYYHENLIGDSGYSSVKYSYRTNDSIFTRINYEANTYVEYYYTLSNDTLLLCEEKRWYVNGEKRGRLYGSYYLRYDELFPPLCWSF